MPPGHFFRTVVPAGSRRDRALWLCVLAGRKLREGPLPFFRAVKTGIYQRLPARVQGALLRLLRRHPRQVAAATVLPAGCTEVAGRVTVVLPVYQQSDMLGPAIESVLAQTHPDFELIVLDDGSDAAVAEVMLRYAADRRVRLLRQPNQGLPKALTAAFELAQGEFFCWTSADNLMEPEQLSQLVARLRARPDVAMVYADYVIIDENGDPVRGTDFRTADRDGPDDPHIRVCRDTTNLNVVQDNFIGPCFCYRGAVGRLLGDYNPELGLEDYDYWMRIHRLFGIEHLGSDAPLYRYRVHDNSLSARARELKIFERGQRLMAYERLRHDWQLATCCVAVDAASREFTAPLLLDSERLVDLGEVAAAASDGKAMVVMHGRNLPELDLDALPPTAAVAAWFDDPVDVYRAHVQLLGGQVIAFGDTPQVSARLAVFTRQAFTQPRGAGMLELARRFVADRTFMASTRKPETLLRALPRPLLPGRPKVLLQADNFVQGGLERVVLDLGQCLARQGAEVTLLVLGRTGPDAEQARAAGLRVVEFGGDTGAEPYRELLRRGGFDVVNAHDSLAGAEVAAELQIPFVQTIHNAYVWLSPERLDAYRRADAHTTAYVAVSTQSLLYADLRLGLDVGKAVVLPNGIDLETGGDHGGGGAEHPLRRQLGLAADDYVFLNVASQYPPKAQRIAVRALASLLPQHPRLRLVLLGRTMDEHYARIVAAEVERLGVAHAVVQAGYHADPRPFYAMADAFLLPSYWEGCSLAVLEAIAAGLPLVLSDVGAAREQLRWGRGALIQPPFGSIAELDANNLGRYVNEVQDDFVTRTAAAMLQVASDPTPHEAPDSTWAFDRRQMADAYLRLFGWLRQGGTPAAARAWLRRGSAAEHAPPQGDAIGG